MRTILELGLLPLLGLLPAPLTAQAITLAEGTPGALQVVTLPESNPAAAGSVLLGNVELLPIERTGRTLAQELDPGQSRRAARHGLFRIELPGGGRVYRYRRLGGQYWGFLEVVADGSARVLVELAGTGAAGTSDPFLDRIGVAADGLHAVVAAPSMLQIVRLSGGSYASTGLPHRALASPAVVEPASVMVGSTHAFWQTADARLWRCSLADGAQPFDVTPPPVQGTILKDQMGLSGDGTKLVVLYGPRDQQRLWLLTGSGAATALPPPPSKYEEPGYLPEDPGEPAMMLNHAGTRLFYVDSLLRDELHLLDLQGLLPDLQITSDAVFQPYIGVHILPSFRGDALAIAIGDPGRMDWFRAELNAQGGAVTNLTGTGSLLQPFPSGALDPRQVAPAGPTLLAAEQLPGGALALRRLDPVGGGNAVLHQDLVALPLSGWTPSGAPDLIARGAGGDRLYLGSTGSILAATPAGLLLAPPEQGPLLAATWLHLPGTPGQEWGFVVFYLPDGSVFAGPFEQGVRQVAMTARGGAVVVGNPLRYLALGTYQVLARPAMPFRAVL
jgi:hypothetical protein